MNTNYTVGMEIPELDIAYFIDNGKFDLNRYMNTCREILENVKDEKVHKDLGKRYWTDRIAEVSIFKEAWNNIWDKALDPMFYKHVRSQFRVGEWYPTKLVKEKLKGIYDNILAPDELYGKVAKMIDIERNGWFSYKYTHRIINDKRVNGIWITDCLI